MALVKYLTRYISDSVPSMDSKKLAEIEYGLTMLLLTVVETSIILLLAYFIGILRFVLIVFLSFGGVRIAAGGFHAKSLLFCFFSGLAIYLGIVFVSIHYPLPRLLLYGLTLLSLLNLYLFAPADNINKPICSARHRLRLKITSIFIALMLFLSAYIQNDNKIANTVIISVFIASLAITPLAYKLTGMERRESCERIT